MEYRRLGNSGLEVSVVGLGTNNFGKRMGDADLAARIIRTAVEHGVNLLDPSDDYGDERDSERFIGQAIKGMRSRVLIATKVGTMPGDESKGGTASRLRIIRGLEASLQALDSDYVDLYQIHRPDPDTPIEETLRALDDLVTSGKVRYIGCSNYSAWETCEALWASRTQHVSPFVSVQPRYNILNREIEEELVPLCMKYNLGILPYYPLAGGFLTGKYHRGQPPPEGARLTYHTRQAQQWISDPNLDLLEELEQFSVGLDHTLVELAFAWLLANGQVSSVIAGATRPEQVQANAAAGEWRLTPEEKAEVDLLLANAS